MAFLIFFYLFSHIKANHDIESIKNKELVNNKYQILQRIGGGSYGSVYDGINIKTGDIVAIKFESMDTMYHTLRYEYERYALLNTSEHFPRVYWAGVYGGYYALVLQRLGESLDKRKRPVETRVISFIGEQILVAIEQLHNISIIHRDIKPSNILIGNSTDMVPRYYLIDLGSATTYCYGSISKGECGNPFSGQSNGFSLPKYHHFLYEEDMEMVGTMRYASLNAFLERELSRRDDLESLAYTLMFLHRNLPWQGALPTGLDSDQVLRFSKQLRFSTSLSSICFGMPDELCTFLKYTRSLGFYEQPNYRYLRSLLFEMRKSSQQSQQSQTHRRRIV